MNSLIKCREDIFLIKDYMCDDCHHVLVCDRIKVLDKFNDDNKGFINIDITMDDCKDFMPVEKDG